MVVRLYQAGADGPGKVSMTRKQLQRATGTRAVPDLWHFAPGGTHGTLNLGSNLYDMAEQVADEQERPDYACEQCGQPTQGLRRCDDCIDGDALERMPEVTARNCSSAEGC